MHADVPLNCRTGRAEEVAIVVNASDAVNSSSMHDTVALLSTGTILKSQFNNVAANESGGQFCGVNTQRLL